MKRGDSLFRGTSLGPSPTVFEELGPTREMPPANMERGRGTHIHAMHAGGRFGTSVAKQERSRPEGYNGRTLVTVITDIGTSKVAR